MPNFDCSPELAKTLLELRQKAKGDYAGQSFARKIIRQAMDFREVGRTEALRLLRWTYSWM